MFTIAHTHATPSRLSSTAPAPRPINGVRPLVSVYSRTEGSSNRGGSGIHDPIGWGQRGGAVRPHEAGLEEAQRQQAAHLVAAQERSTQMQDTHPGTVGVDRHEAAQREILEVEGEKAVTRELSQSDDEWEHMPVPKKWYMEAKALLYSWLKTGVEPL